MEETNYWTRWARRRLSRRRVLVSAASISAGAAGLAIVGCGGDGDDGEPTGTAAPGETPQAAGTPVRGGVYKFAITGDWGTIDPVTSVAFAPLVFARVYNTLIEQSRRDPTFFFFDVAQTLEQPDDATYVYSIRPGVKIAPNTHNVPERDLDSEDAKRWLDRVTADEASVIRGFTNQFLDTYEAADASTFTIKTKGPYAYFLLRAGAPLGGTIPPREFFDREEAIKDHGVGAGPFSIRNGTYQETGGITLDANPNYYRTDENNNNEKLPYIEGMEAVRITDRQPRRTAFVDGQIHTYDPESRDEVSQLEGQIPGLVIAEDPANTFIAFTMNPRNEPWTDERMRKAALYALNRQEFVDQVVGGDGQPNGLVHWPLGAFALDPEELEQLQPYDPAMSRELIRAVTGEDSISIKVMYPANSDIEFHKDHLPIFLQQMRDAGFNIEEEPLDFTNWLARYTNLEYDASLSLNQIYETAEIPVDFHAAKGPQGGELFAVGIGGLFPEIEEAIQETKRTTDPEELIAKVKEVQRLIYEKGPAFLPIMSWIDFAVYRPAVKNHPALRGIGATDLYLNDWWLES